MQLAPLDPSTRSIEHAYVSPEETNGEWFAGLSMTSTTRSTSLLPSPGFDHSLRCLSRPQSAGCGFLPTKHLALNPPTSSRYCNDEPPPLGLPKVDCFLEEVLFHENGDGNTVVNRTLSLLNALFGVYLKEEGASRNVAPEVSEAMPVSHFASIVKQLLGDKSDISMDKEEIQTAEEGAKEAAAVLEDVLDEVDDLANDGDAMLVDE